MPLINCPVCGHQISAQAVSCPQCGHPNRMTPQPTKGPKCYACSDTATTRCQKCGAFSCAQHLQNIYVSHGRGGANELRCESCYASAQTSQMVGRIIGVILLIIFAFFFFYVLSQGANPMRTGRYPQTSKSGPIPIRGGEHSP